MVAREARSRLLAVADRRACQPLKPHAANSKKPGLTARAFLERQDRAVDQAAGLNSFDALALIGSTVSVATFWDNSASSLVWAVKASNCFLA